MKLTYACIPAVLLVAEGVLAFSGCGSSTQKNDHDAGGPSCEPACPDALEEPLGDVHLADAGTDAGVTCATLCSKLSNEKSLKGCHDPGCTGACERQDLGCETAEGLAAAQALLDCEMTATYACSAAKPPLPVTTGCEKQIAAVAAACSTEGGGADAGCSGAVTPEECTSCCAGMHSEGAEAYSTALTDCVCGTGVCETLCTNSECMAATPEAGSPCAVCIGKSLLPDGGGCASPVSAACTSDPDCVAYEACLSMNACSKK